MFNTYFQMMMDREASDLFLKGGSLVSMRINGLVTPCSDQPLADQDVRILADELMSPELQRQFLTARELNFAFEREGIGRFRANVLWQQGRMALVVRRVQKAVRDFETLHLPGGMLRRLANERQGLVLVTGPTASGKSTTVSAFVEYINQTQPCHIVTLEDPIEFVYQEQRALINQRDVGVDTTSFSEGLRNVLRQSPDVLYLSDLRDLETVEAAIQAAESGQLVLSCIHTTNVLTTLERMIAFYPAHQHAMIRFRLSLILKGVLCLRLLPRRDGRGQMPVTELMVMTSTIRELLREGDLAPISQLIHEGATQGMMTQTQSLYHLVSNDHVSLQDALKISDCPGDLQLALREIRATKDIGDGQRDA